jgi:hypothetical protein
MTQIMIVELTDWLGEHVAVNRRLSEIIGIWSADEPDDSLQIQYAVMSRLFGNHAQLLESQMADSPSLEASSFIRLGSRWSPLAQPDDTNRLGFLQTAVDKLRSDYADVWERLNPVSDASLQRTMRHIQLDLS